MYISKFNFVEDSSLDKQLQLTIIFLQAACLTWKIMINSIAFPKLIYLDIIWEPQFLTFTMNIIKIVK